MNEKVQQNKTKTKSGGFSELKYIYRIYNKRIINFIEKCPLSS